MTYSCINCQRTFPYVNSWYEKYKDQGLIVIGIHTPEFAFEHNIKNVETAMREFGIKFPVVLDNSYGTWNAYGNNYWPRKYLIDLDGYIVYDHIGEGEYDKTEAKIVELLGLSQDLVSTGGDDSLPSIFTRPSPESYLGTTRSQFDVSAVQACTGGVCTYKTQESIPRDRFALTGTWNKQPEYVELLSATGIIKYNFNAKKVYLVAEAPTDVLADIYIDGKKTGEVTFNSARLYQLVDLEEISNHLLEIRVKNQGLKAYAFTFGI